ncbi:MAG: GntR family transcriptional regulator [Devosia sp.]|uniref:GntR family transcriptional regulator n=1 Tax=Devosia sp. TaxID=1871048 RepID=UPI001AC32798|nr:GntR family transcriptional regulator [Devosia sp.]MBN9315722.1 GntR family transcriptional regulator [Devosia sp.]
MSARTNRPVTHDGKVETTYQRVTNLIRNEIIAGAILPGGRLTMTALAERFGCSVQPVREALQQLEGEGLVEMIPNAGARVRALDRNLLVHAHEIGEALETFLTRQFAEEASLSAIRRLEALQAEHDAATAAMDWARIDAANHAFHRFINTHGGNLEAAGLISRYYGLSESLMNSQGRDSAFADRVRTEHHALLEAFRARDPEAAARINTAHVRGTLAVIMDAFEALPKPERPIHRLAEVTTKA